MMTRKEIWPAHSEALDPLATLSFDEPPTPGQMVEIGGDVWVITRTEDTRVYVQPYSQG